MKNQPQESTELEQQAENAVLARDATFAANIEALSVEETRQLLHKLRVHEIEL